MLIRRLKVWQCISYNTTNVGHDTLPYDIHMFISQYNETIKTHNNVNWKLNRTYNGCKSVKYSTSNYMYAIK